MRKLLSPFFATRSISRIVSSGRVMLMRRCTVTDPQIGAPRIHIEDVYVNRTPRGAAEVYRLGCSSLPEEQRAQLLLAHEATGLPEYCAQSAGGELTVEWDSQRLPQAIGCRAPEFRVTAAGRDDLESSEAQRPSHVR